MFRSRIVILALLLTAHLAMVVPAADPLSTAARRRAQTLADRWGHLRLVIAGPGYMWGIDRQIEAELQAAGMHVLAYPDVPMIDSAQPPRVSSWELLSRYNVLIFGDPFLNSAEPDPQTGQLPPWIQNTVALMRRFLDEGGGIFFCGNGEANFGNVVAYNYILKELGLDAQVVGEQVRDPATQVALPNTASTMNWCWTDAVLESPLTDGVKGLWVPFAYGGDGGLGVLPVKVGPDWQMLVRGLPTAASFAVDRNASKNGPTVFHHQPGAVKSSPLLIAARPSNTGRVVLWPMWTHFGLLCGSSPGVGGWLIDGQHQARHSDGARLLENLLCWLVEPSQGSTAIGRFVPARVSVPPAPVPDLGTDSAAWVLPQGKREYPRQFKGLIGVHSNLSDGQAAPLELIAAAKKAGYHFLAFTEDLTRMDRAKYAKLVSLCRETNTRDPGFVAYPGLDFRTDADDRNLAFGMPYWPPKDAFSAAHPGRLTWLYGLTYQVSNVPSKWPPLVIIDSKSNHKRPWNQGFWSFFSPYCYEAGKLTDDSMDEWRPLIGRYAFHSVADLMAVHAVRSPQEIEQAAQPGLYQTWVGGDRLPELLQRLSGSNWGRGESANYISNGPVVESFYTRIIGNSEGADLSIRGNNRGQLHLRVSSDVGLKEINVYDRQKLAGRIIPDRNQYQAVLTFHYDDLHVFSLEVIDRQDRRALSWAAWAGVYERVHRRGGDNWNWMTTGKPRRGAIGYLPWNGMEAFGGSAEPTPSYSAGQADYFHSGLRTTWFNTHLASKNQGGLLVDGKYEDRFPSRTMDFATVGRYGVILTNRFPQDMVVREPPNYTFREMSGPFAVIPSAWPAEMTEYAPEPRFNGTRVARSIGCVRFARQVATPGGEPIAVSLGISNEYGINPLNAQKGILELVSPDGTSQRHSLTDLKPGEQYKGRIPVNGYLCWYGPDARGLGGIVALSPGIHYTCAHKHQEVLIYVPSPAEPGTEVTWDCLFVTGSVHARNSDEEMQAVLRGLGIVAKPTLYRVQPRIGAVADQKFFLTLQTDSHSFSGTIARTTEQPMPIHLPVMVKDLNPRWDAGIWYRGRTLLEVVRKFRDPWGVESPYRMTGAYEARQDELQWIPVLQDRVGYCQIDMDKQDADIFIGNFLLCDQPEVFLTIVKAEKGKCTFEINNPTDRPLRCTVRPANGFDLVGTFQETISLQSGELRTLTVPTTLQ